MNQEQIQQMIDEAIRTHEHEGNISKQIQLENIFGLIRTVDSAADLINVLASTPRDLFEQIFIDTSTATKKLYIYDTIGNVWYSVVIA